MSQPRKLEREHQILKLLNAGWPVARVARHFKLSNSRVCYIRERAKSERNPFFSVRAG